MKHVVRVTQRIAHYRQRTLKSRDAPIAVAADSTAQTITLTMPRGFAVETYESALESVASTEVWRQVASVERNAWAFDVVRDKLGFLRGVNAR